MRTAFSEILNIIQVKRTHVTNIRLVSAFQDKIADTKNGFERIRQKLKRQYGGLTFANFARFLLDRAERRCQDIDECRLNVHWLPYIARWSQVFATANISLFIICLSDAATVIFDTLLLPGKTDFDLCST